MKFERFASNSVLRLRNAILVSASVNFGLFFYLSRKLPVAVDIPLMVAK